MIDVIEIKELLTNNPPVICKLCGGNGVTVDNSWGSGFNDTCTCTLCNGTGRTIKAELVVVAEIAFDTNINKGK